RVTQLAQGHAQHALLGGGRELHRERGAAAELDAGIEPTRQDQRDQSRDEHRQRDDVEQNALADKIDHASGLLPERLPRTGGSAAAFACLASSTSAPKSQRWRITGVPMSARRNVRVTVMAENMLTPTPRASVSANP